MDRSISAGRSSSSRRIFMIEDTLPRATDRRTHAVRLGMEDRRMLSPSSETRTGCRRGAGGAGSRERGIVTVAHDRGPAHDGLEGCRQGEAQGLQADRNQIFKLVRDKKLDTC